MQTHEVTSRFQFSPLHTLRNTEGDGLRGIEQLLGGTKRLIDSETQTIGTDEESISGLESELRRVKEQLENAEIHITYLLERVGTYRRKWLEDYYRAENLERCMPDSVVVPNLGQIPEGAASPAFCPELFSLEEEGSELRASL
ncbi:uncharacterized protein F5891DRAFT_1191036 [Suillus fuscotomentosus]|uniref:Uncharacterized protein n=1 Tax=Suillus fuscotomentosus TaxID=1912939 RepID=A0AAD4E287_9AGAM|nr:uncharacterized protein F5891DRAFT_1191036 [Suillus fuscotomentosus]KAG1898356.1 hypothetical protein F5891DRAFT_1191036 [Suillus fuscotomentosus]